jgi:polyhydroxybutyrate depolymerase
MKTAWLRSKKKSRLPAFAVFLAGIALISFLAPAARDQRDVLIHDGLKRRFMIYKPSVDNAFLRMPVVIALHGRGINGKSMVILTRRGFEKLAAREKFIVVYPDGIGMSWNDGRTDEEANDRAFRNGIDDVGFISALIDYMTGHYNADPSRIFVTGISNGAIMSYRLACELSDKITAIAPVDGNIPLMLYQGCSPTDPVSVLAINNVDDPLVPFDGGEIYIRRGKVKLGKILSTEKSIEFWVSRNKCSVTPIVSEEPDRDPRDGTRVTRKYYGNGLKGTDVVLYEIKGGGHTWPGGIQYKPEAVIGRTSRDIDASEVIWSFFKNHSKQPD